MDALVVEKTTFSTLATTHCLIRRARNYGYVSKKSYVLRVDSNRIITMKLQAKDGKSPYRMLLSVYR